MCFCGLKSFVRIVLKPILSWNAFVLKGDV